MYGPAGQKSSVGFFAFSKRKFLRMLLKAFADTKKKYKGSAFCV